MTDRYELDTIRELIAERDRLAAELEAALTDTKRLLFLAKEYDYVDDCVDEPSDEDILNSMRRLIDAAIEAA